MKLRKIKLKYIFLFVFFFILFIALIINTLFVDKEDNKKFSSLRPDVQENSNKISYGLYDQKGEIIDNGSTLNVKNGKLSKVISLSHFVPNEREYALIILKNYQQTEFKVKGKKHMVYNFKMKPNTTINIDAVVDVKKGEKEIDYIIIKRPDYLLEEKSIQKASILQEVISMRFNIGSTKSKEVTFKKPFKKVVDGPMDNVFLSENMNKLKIMYKMSEGKNVFLSAGNLDKDKKQTYALIALSDWLQVPLQKNRSKDTIYVSVPPNTREIFKVTLPNVKAKKNYQVIALPNPYNVSKTNYTSQTTFGTVRTLLQPDN